MEIETKIVDIKKINENINNPRKIDKTEFELLKKSLKEFPEMLEIREIVVDENYIILGGNMRYKALKELGEDKAVIKIIKGLTEEQKKEFIIKDNVAFGRWDYAKLENWNTKNLANWNLAIRTKVKDDNFEISNEIETDIKEGDIIEIGRHKLICGDCTKQSILDKLLQGEKANFVFTDPPFDFKDNRSYADIIYNNIENANVFLMHSDKGIVDYLKNSKLEFVYFLISYVIFSMPNPKNPYLSHTIISYERKGKSVHFKNLHDGFSTVINTKYRGNIDELESVNFKHQKSIELVSSIIEHYSNENDLILDIFGGSGTTMAAAEKLNRRCYMVEIEPKNCQLIVNRMQKIINNEA